MDYYSIIERIRRLFIYFKLVTSNIVAGDALSNYHICIFNIYRSIFFLSYSIANVLRSYLSGVNQYFCRTIFRKKIIIPNKHQNSYKLYFLPLFMGINGYIIRNKYMKSCKIYKIEFIIKFNRKEQFKQNGKVSKITSTGKYCLL